jgi:DNA polymerase I
MTKKPLFPPVDALLVDGPYLAHRSYGAPYKLTTSKGKDATMIHSFLVTLNSLRKQLNPSEIIIAWESHGTKSWRRSMLQDYKPSSGKVTQDYVEELIDLQLILHLLNIKQYYSPSNEADDVLARLAKEKQGKVLIYTVDKDLMQLVDEDTYIFDGRTKMLIEEQHVRVKFGVEPYQIPDLLAIAGDVCDNIKGIDNYGIKKAAKLLSEYIHIEGIPNDHELVIDFGNVLEFNKKLTSLNSDCELLPIPNDDFSSTETIESMFVKYEFHKFQEKIPELKLLGGSKDAKSKTNGLSAAI